MIKGGYGKICLFNKGSDNMKQFSINVEKIIKEVHRYGIICCIINYLAIIDKIKKSIEFWKLALLLRN